MNIQGLISSINTVINAANSKTADSVPVEQVNKDGQNSSTTTGTNTAEANKQTSDVKLSDQESVKSLLKELSVKFTAAQKAFDNMPESIKNELRQLLSQRATLFDMPGGLSNLVQGQKDIYNNLNKLAETLNNLARFLADAEQPQAQQTKPTQLPQLPQGANEQALPKNAVLEKMDAQLIKQLLEFIEKENQLPETKTQNNPQAQKETAKQAAQTVINRQTANTTPQQLSQNTVVEGQKEVHELLKNIYQELSKGEAIKQNQQPVKDEAALKEQQQTINKEQQQTVNKEQPNKNQNIRQGNEEFFKNATVVKGLVETLAKENLTELLNNLKSMNAKATNPEQAKPDDVQKNAQTVNQQAQNAPKQLSEGNVLLQQAKLALPTQTPTIANVTPQQVEQLVNNMKSFSMLMSQNAADNPQLAKALQTLSANPALLSMEEKALLQSVMAQIIKDVFKDKNELDVLEKALNRLSSKNKMFLDKETTDLQTFSKLLKNTETLQYSRQQVEKWASSLRDLASGMAKTSGFAAERSNQHLHSSFVFNLATDGQEKNNPVYINIYHEKEDSANAGKAAETWLRVKVEPEHMGEVTAIFHLYQENLLDVKVIFNNPEAMDEFNRFVPNIEEAFQNTHMQLNSIMLI